MFAIHVVCDDRYRIDDPSRDFNPNHNLYHVTESCDKQSNLCLQFRPPAPIILARMVASVLPTETTILANVHSCTLETTANTVSSTNSLSTLVYKCSGTP